LYTFSSVVDDVDSEISHIIRGQDHVTNTAVQIALFEAISGKTDYGIGFAHISLLLSEDGTQFSKRSGSVNLKNLRDLGVDPMTIFNFLATIGSSLDVSTFLKIEDLVAYFDISKISSNSPKFGTNDIMKLNKKIIRSRQYSEIKSFGISEKAFEVVKDNIVSYKDLAIWQGILSENFIGAYFPDAPSQKILKVLIEELDGICVPLDECIVKTLLSSVEYKAAVKGRSLYLPIRMAITDMENGPNLVQLFILLGKEEILKRFRRSVEKTLQT
jgi:glutamyl-tRNA synthetase